MNTAAIEKFSVWARTALREGVILRAERYRLFGDDAPGADELIEVAGRAITEAERSQRAALLRRVREAGQDAFVEQMAALWFNRLVAIRYMEVHDFLPSRTRIFSDAEGQPRSQALAEAASLVLPGLDRAQVLELKAAGTDEPLFRRILLAQCAQLAEAMPRVFSALDSADALMLPDNLLAPGSVCRRLVEDLPDVAWETVEVIGWAYQFYNAEVKDEVFMGFKKKRKAETVAQIGPATQLFTPEWIVRYMVENSLGRLWMLNNPGSALRERMRYYIEPEGQTEDFIRIEGPEDIRVLDPACGSGHILVYAFDLLAAMYEERGYRARDAARFIVEKNLAGLEIDERAGQLAILALTMKARELDRRFLTSGITPDVRVLTSVAFTEEELAEVPQLLPYAKELDVLAHLSEAGSLFEPAAEFVAALDDAAASIADDDLMTHDLAQKLKAASDQCHALTRTFDVCAGNPPYMGSGNFGAWLSTWTKKAYPDTKSDLCTMFIERGLRLCKPRGSFAMITASSWMFISSFENFRKKLLKSNNITSMIQQSTHGFPRVTVPTTMFTLETGTHAGKGSYIRLEDFDRPALQEPKALEAIQNPDCGYFYRSDATNFKSIPGTPIAYWACEAMYNAFKTGRSLADVARPRQGLSTGDNGRFLRNWWEVANNRCGFGMESRDEAKQSSKRWFPCNKGGGFRKWYGLNEIVINWENDGEELCDFPGSVIRNPDYYFREGMTWGTTGSAVMTMRYSPIGFISEHKGSMCFAPSHDALIYCLGFVNSSFVLEALLALAPTIDFGEGSIGKLPIDMKFDRKEEVEYLAESNIALSRADWDSLETSWDFKRNPLV